MDEALQEIRAQEAYADEVYANHYSEAQAEHYGTSDVDEDWFIHALMDLAPKGE